MDKVFSAREAAEILGISRTAIGKLLKSGVLEGKKNEKGYWEITKNDLDVYIASDNEPRTDAIKEDQEKFFGEEPKPSRFVMNDYVPGM